MSDGVVEVLLRSAQAVCCEVSTSAVEEEDKVSKNEVVVEA
jgi:hypothetical protein